jgi:hypothetical protein
MQHHDGSGMLIVGWYQHNQARPGPEKVGNLVSQVLNSQSILCSPEKVRTTY